MEPSRSSCFGRSLGSGMRGDSLGLTVTDLEFIENYPRLAAELVLPLREFCHHTILHRIHDFVDELARLTRLHNISRHVSKLISLIRAPSLNQQAVLQPALFVAIVVFEMVAGQVDLDTRSSALAAQ
jgi:hypothetical protein